MKPRNHINPEPRVLYSRYKSTITRKSIVGSSLLEKFIETKHRSSEDSSKVPWHKIHIIKFYNTVDWLVKGFYEAHSTYKSYDFNYRPLDPIHVSRWGLFDTGRRTLCWKELTFYPFYYERNAPSTLLVHPFQKHIVHQEPTVRYYLSET